MSDPNHDMLIKLDTKVESILLVLKDMSVTCKDRGNEITNLRIAQSKTDERVETHNKFLWGSVMSSISAIIGLIAIGVKSMISTGKTP